MICLIALLLNFPSPFQLCGHLNAGCAARHLCRLLCVCVWMCGSEKSDWNAILQADAIDAGAVTDGGSAERRSAQCIAAIFTVVSTLFESARHLPLVRVETASPAGCVGGSQRAQSRAAQQPDSIRADSVTRPRRCRVAWSGGPTRHGAGSLCSTLVSSQFAGDTFQRDRQRYSGREDDGGGCTWSRQSRSQAARAKGEGKTTALARQTRT